MQLRSLVGMGVGVGVTALVLAGLSGVAHARPALTVVSPEDGVLAFGRVPFDVPSAPQRIVIRNTGDPVGSKHVSASGMASIIATGGGLGTGESQFWDVVCTPTILAESGQIDLELCGQGSCEDDWHASFWLGCTGGLLAPVGEPVFLSAYEYEVAHATVVFENPGPDPVTVTGIGACGPSFSTTPASGALPVTLAPGDRLDIDASFSPVGDDTFCTLDLLTGTSIVAREYVYAGRLGQLSPPAASLGLLPLGAVYTTPISVRNSFPSTRTITVLSSGDAACTVTGLVGTTLAPGAFAYGVLTRDGDALGARLCTLTVAFDQGQGDIARIFFDVVPATFSVTVDDATPDDGRLDFGTRKAGSGAVERTITIRNLSSVARDLFGCFASAPFELVSVCPAALAANGSVELTLRFTPGDVGEPSGTLSFALLGLGSLATALNARVVASQLAVSTTELTLADTTPGAPTTRVVSVSNAADHPITIPLAVTGAGFSIAAPEVTIAGRATVAITVTFQPTAAGSFTGALTLGVAGDPDHAIVALAGTGLPAAPPPVDDPPVDDPPVDDPPVDDPPEDPAGGGCSVAGRGGPGTALVALMALMARRRRRAERASAKS